MKIMNKDTMKNRVMIENFHFCLALFFLFFLSLCLKKYIKFIGCKKINFLVVQGAQKAEEKMKKFSKIVEKTIEK